jgi:hypothetical protein
MTSGLFPLDFCTKALYAPFLSPIRAARTAYMYLKKLLGINV